jgi:hypothetical protein
MRFIAAAMHFAEPARRDARTSAGFVNCKV